jgi:hypothetical protein
VQTKSKKPEISAPQAVCDVVHAGPPNSQLICAPRGDFYFYIPKSIPKNIGLISSQVGFNTNAVCLQYGDRSRLATFGWPQ